MAQGNQDFSFRVFDYAYGDLEWIVICTNHIVVIPAGIAGIQNTRM